MQNSKMISDFLSYLTEAQTENNISADTLKYTDDLSQDILHKLELEDLNYSERAKLATKLRDTRRERRSVKDSLAVTDLVVEWIGENRDTIHSLQRLLGDVRKKEKCLTGRIYISRTDEV